MAYEVTILGPERGAEGDFPNLAYAMQSIAAHARGLWVGYAAGKPIPGGGQIRARSGAYLRSIQLRQEGPYAWELFSDAPHASAIERGMPARDLKKMLGSSWRVREVKDGKNRGKRYLIIPFRHGYPGANYGAMPKAVHAVAKDLSASYVVGQRKVPTVPVGYSVATRQRMMVTRNTYQWGDRLSPAVAESLVPTRRGHTTSIYSNMVRFDRPGGSGISGGHSQYMTFRIMGEWSSGWIAPARPGLYPLRAVRDQIMPIAERAAKAALEIDMAALIEKRLQVLAA